MQYAEATLLIRTKVCELTCVCNSNALIPSSVVDSGVEILDAHDTSRVRLRTISIWKYVLSLINKFDFQFNGNLCV